MAISEAFAGSEAVSTTEWSLTTDTAGPDAQTDDGEYQVFLDLNALGNGDTFEFRIYEKAQAADTQRVYFTRTFSNAQGVDSAGWVSQSFLLMHGFDMTLKRTAGSDRTITWSIRKIDHASGSGLDAAGVRTAVGLASANLDTQLSGIQSDADNIQTRLPAALVSGRMDSSIGAVATGAIAAAAFAAGALDAVWSVTARLLTAGTNIALAKGTGVTGFTDLDAAGVRTAVGLATANLDTQLTAIDDLLDTEVAAIVTAVSAASIRTAVGLASANLDTQLADLPTNAELATSQAAADDATLAAVAALSIPTANANADALLDRAAGIETNRTLRQGLRLMLAAMVGKASGLAGTTATYRDTNDGVDRIVATVDADGNRSVVTLDAS